MSATDSAIICAVIAALVCAAAVVFGLVGRHAGDAGEGVAFKVGLRRDDGLNGVFPAGLVAACGKRCAFAVQAQTERAGNGHVRTFLRGEPCVRDAVRRKALADYLRNLADARVIVFGDVSRWRLVKLDVRVFDDAGRVCP